MLQTTETLIAGLAANDETRWARFYRDYAPYIERALLKHTPLSPSDVEDVIHETLVARVAADLGLSENALYQIKNRLTERLAAEVRTLVLLGAFSHARWRQRRVGGYAGLLSSRDRAH